MAKIEVEAPDGSVIEFPEGTSDETINKVMAQEFGPKTTGLGAAAAGLGQGVLFGFGDEAAAGAGAAYDYFTGQGDFSSSYDKRLKGQREYLKSAAKDNPGWYYSGMIGGALAVPFTTPGRVATLGAGRLADLGARLVAQRGAPRLAASISTPGTLGRATATGLIEGAGYGALSGAGMSEGNAQALLEGTASGAAMGGALGAAAPVAIQGITSGVRAGLNRAQDVLRPQVAATRDVARGVMEGVAPAPPRGDMNIARRAEQFLHSPQGQNVNDEFLRIDAGERTRALARRASNLSPEARDTLERTIIPRSDMQTNRAAQLLTRQRPGATGDNSALREALVDQRYALNRPAYERAFAQGDRPLNSPVLERLQSAPEFRRAMQEAVPEYQDRAVLDGFQGFNARVRTTNDGQIIFNRGPEGPPAYPNLAFYDTVKKIFDRQAERNLRETGSRGTAGQFARELRNELDNLVPAYGATRSQAFRLFQAEDAVEAGENFARGGINANAAQAMRAKRSMSPGDRERFEMAYTNALINKVRNTPDKADIAKRFARTAAERDQLRVGMGSRRAREFEAYLYAEGIMDMAKTALTANSTTMRQFMEMGGAGVGSGVLFGGGDPTSPAFWQSFVLGAGGAAGARRLNATIAEQWARQVADLLTSQGNPQALERAIQRLASNDRFVETMRRGLSRMSATTSGIAGGSVGAQTAPLRVEVTRGDVERNNPNAP